MYKKLHLLVFAFILLIPAFSFAQFKVSAELRPRFEISNGTLAPKPYSLTIDYFFT